MHEFEVVKRSTTIKEIKSSFWKVKRTYITSRLKLLRYNNVSLCKICHDIDISNNIDTKGKNPSILFFCLCYLLWKGIDCFFIIFHIQIM